MNYYNPYFVSMQPAVFTQKAGLFSRLFNGINLGKILNGTQKVLNFANQTIPLVQQVRPMIGNAKTMFKVMNEFKKVDTPDLPKKEVKTQVTDDTFSNSSTDYSEGPTFFI